MWQQVAYGLGIGCLGYTLVSGVAFAQNRAGQAQEQEPVVYKWTNRLGQVQYTELPPPDNVPFETVRRAGNSERREGASGADGESSEAPRDLTQDQADLAEQIAERERQEADRAKKAKEVENERRGKNCDIARQNVEMLEGEKPVIMPDAAGKKILLDPEQRVEALQRAKKDEAYFCSP